MVATRTFAWLGAIAICGCAGAPRTWGPDAAKIHDGTVWSLTNVEVRTAVEDGRSAVHLAPIGGDHQGSNVGMALVTGARFAQGTIDVDLLGRGDHERAFLGVTFGATDAHTFEAIYFRPFRFRDADATDRAHAVQYVAWPEHTWEELRARTPGI